MLYKRPSSYASVRYKSRVPLLRISLCCIWNNWLCLELCLQLIDWLVLHNQDKSVFFSKLSSLRILALWTTVRSTKYTVSSKIRREYVVYLWYQIKNAECSANAIYKLGFRKRTSTENSSTEYIMSPPKSFLDNFFDYWILQLRQSEHGSYRCEDLC